MSSQDHIICYTVAYLPAPDVVDTSPPVVPFTALSLSTQSSITASPVVNEDLFYEAYLSSTSDFKFPSSFSAMIPLPLNIVAPSVFTSDASASPFPFNSVLDSGCTNHIFRDRSLFWTYDPGLATPVKTANCGFLQTLAQGIVRFRVVSGGRSVVFVLKDCLHAPDAPINLLSVGAFAEKGVHVTFMQGRTTISFPSSDSVLSGFSFDATVQHRLSFLDCDFVRPPASPALPLVDPPTSLLTLDDSALVAVFPHIPLTPDLWHRRFGHPGMEATRAMLTKDYATGLEHTGLFERSRCIACLIGKSPQHPYTNHGRRSTVFGELLHMDTCGPFPVLTPRKESFFLSILEDSTNFSSVGLLAKKSDAYDFFCATEAKIERVSGARVLTVRMDGAPELCEGRLGSHLRGRGITIQVTAPYAHPQNGKAERYIRTLEDGMQTLLANSGLPFSFWGDAVCTYQYLRNRMPTSVLPSGTTPFEAYRHQKPDLSHLRVWGCQCFVAIPPELRTKGGPR